jgi:hypothetical protein
VRLDLFDVTGRLVRRLVDAPAGSRAVRVAWDGRDDAGTLVAPGTYFARLAAGGEREEARVVLRR